MAIDIREATEADLGRIREIALAAWRAAHAPIVGTEAAELFVDEHYDRAAFEPYLADGPLLLAVAIAEHDGLVGFASAGPDDDSRRDFHLGRIYVDPKRWREGIGRRLLAHVETRVANRGGERITLGVMAENDRALTFYDPARYERVDEFYDDRLDTRGYTYEKMLT